MEPERIRYVQRVAGVSGKKGVSSMAFSNRVIDGDYLDAKVVRRSGKLILQDARNDDLVLDITTVAQYKRFATRQEYKGYNLNGKSLIGGMILGPVGALFGLEREAVHIHQVALQFQDGKKSLLELNDDTYSELLDELKKMNL